MKITWINSLFSMRDFLAKRLLIAAGASLVLAIGMPALAVAQTSCPPANLGDICPFAGTAGLETGLQDLAFLNMDPIFFKAPSIDWGDLSVTSGLVRCF